MVKQVRRWQTIALLLLVLFFCVLNMPRLTSGSFWADECYAITLSNQSFSQIIETASAENGQPPLHAFILAVAINVFGNSPVVYQGISLLALVILMVVSVWWVRNRFGFSCAAFYILLLVFMRSCINYATEVSEYSWAMLFTTLCMMFAYDIMSSNKIWLWAGLVFFGVCASLTHYYGFVACGFIIIGLLIYQVCHQGVGCLWRYAALAGGIIIIVWAFFSDFARGLANGLVGTAMNEVPPLQSYLLFPFGWGMLGYILLPLAIFIFAIYFLAAFKVSCSFNLRQSEQRNFTYDKTSPDRNTYFVAWCALVFVATLIIGLFITYFVNPSFVEGYLFPCVGILFLGLAISLSRFSLTHKTLKVAVAIVVFAGLLNYGAVWQEEDTFDNNTSDLINATQTIDKSDYILTNNGHLQPIVLPYYYPENQIDSLSLYDWDSIANSTVWVMDTQNAMENGMQATLESKGLNVAYMGQYALHWYPISLYEINK